MSSSERAQFNGLRKQADILLHTRRYGEAITHAKRALELFPDDPRPCIQIAYALARTKNPEAPEWARKAIAKDPDNAVWWGSLSEVFTWLDRWEDALDPMLKAVELDPRSSTLQSGLGLCLIHQKKFKEAIPHLEKALQLNPLNPYTHQRLGLALKRTRHKKEGEQHLRKALELAPDNADIQASLGWDMLLKGMGREAGEAFREALRLDPEQAGPKLGLGDPEGWKVGWNDRLLRASIRLLTVPYRKPLAILHLILLGMILIFMPRQLGPLNVVIAMWCFFFIAAPATIRRIAKKRGIRLG